MIPDPIELMESRIEDLAFEWNQAQQDVPSGLHRCPYCSKDFSYEPIALSSRPDSPVVCYECLPDDLKKSYDDFQNKM